MRISLGLGPRAPLSRQTAWGCLGTNLAMPGFGSLAAGRKVGFFQAALAVAGLTFTAVFGVRFFAWWLANRASLGSDRLDPVEGMLAIWRAARMSLAGIGVFALAWLWPLMTSWRIVAGSRDPEPRNAPPKL